MGSAKCCSHYWFTSTQRYNLIFATNVSALRVREVRYACCRRGLAFTQQLCHEHHLLAKSRQLRNEIYCIRTMV